MSIPSNIDNTLCCHKLSTYSYIYVRWRENLKRFESFPYIERMPMIFDTKSTSDSEVICDFKNNWRMCKNALFHNLTQVWNSKNSSTHKKT